MPYLISIVAGAALPALASTFTRFGHIKWLTGGAAAVSGANLVAELVDGDAKAASLEFATILGLAIGYGIAYAWKGPPSMNAGEQPGL